MCYDITFNMFVVISTIFFIFVVISLLGLVVGFDYFKRTRHKFSITVWYVLFMIVWISICSIVVINHFNNRVHYVDCSKDAVPDN